ncbi:MAG: outer membrane protein assembly factor BamA [Spirochaetales bacterium]|nr:outer membrane protein assembly factor BamA [Candidatus Physcosoma equi]
MKGLKKLIVAILLILIMLPLFAVDEEWFLNRPIGSFSFEGLVNVKEKTASKLVSEFVGKELTYDVINDLEMKLYEQPWIEYIGVDALVAENGWDVDLAITVSECPIIKSVTTVGNERVRRGAILEAQNLQVENWFSNNTAKANAELVKNLYIQKGYCDVVVNPVVEYSDDNQVKIIYDIVEGVQYKVRSVRFEGNDAIATADLKKVLVTKEKTFFESGNFVEANMAEDEQAILTYYANKGYPDSYIVNSRVEVIEEESTDKIQYLNLTYTMDEGDLWYVGDITFSGNDNFDDETIRSLLILNDGDLYNLEKIQHNFDNLASLYYDNGYVYSRLEPQITRDSESHRISIHFNIMEGPQSVIEEIRIIGLTKTKPYVLERELAFKVGDVFSRAAFIQSQQNMYNTSLLKNISASLLQGETENGVICEFKVEEGNQMELQFGATFGATEVNGFPVSGFLSWTNNNVQGTGRALSLGTTLSPSTQNINLSISDKWVGDKRWSNGFSFSAERDVRTDALQQGVGSAPYSGRDYNYETYPFGFSNAHDWYYTAGQVYPDSSYLVDYDYAKFNVGYTSGYAFVFRPGTLSVSAGVSVGLNRAFYDGSKYTPYEELIQKYH